MARPLASGLEANVRKVNQLGHTELQTDVIESAERIPRPTASFAIDPPR
jgi:hypothetical protein